MRSRRSYAVKITVNDRNITEVVIDPHYEKKHSPSINDELILDLVQLLDGKFYEVQASDSDFKYFVADPLILHGLSYRLIWLLEDEKLYVGVINAFRR